MAIPWPVRLLTAEERSARRAGIVRTPTAQRRRKILEIHQELPDRIDVVLIRQEVGFRKALAQPDSCNEPAPKEDLSMTRNVMPKRRQPTLEPLDEAVGHVRGEPWEDWSWCHLDNIAFVVTRP
jgi:hypothetical protein